MKIKIKDINTKLGERGEHYQAIRIQVVSLDGRRFWKDAWIPVDRAQPPYPVGRYEFSDRSYYVNRMGGISFFPRLDFVADLEDDSGPGEPVPVGALLSTEPVVAKAGSWSSDIPF